MTATKEILRWLCPIVSYHPRGAWIVMRRAGPGKAVSHPEYIKAFRDTMKSANWGCLDGRFVLIDYGHARKESIDGIREEEILQKRPR